MIDDGYIYDRMADIESDLAAHFAHQAAQETERLNECSQCQGHMLALAYIVRRSLSAEDRASLEAAWPSLAEMPDGRDVYEGVYPVYGAPDPAALMQGCADGYVETNDE